MSKRNPHRRRKPYKKRNNKQEVKRCKIIGQKFRERFKEAIKIVNIYTRIKYKKKIK